MSRDRTRKTASWFAFLLIGSHTCSAPLRAGDWAISGTVLTPDQTIADGAVTISDQVIKAVGGSTSIRAGIPIIKSGAIVLPGFIDLHNHLTWNILPRWVPNHKFTNRYEWQDTAEYDRALIAPHSAAMASAACEAEIYAEVKAIVGGATSVVGSLMPDKDHPDNIACSKGLARNLDAASDLKFIHPLPNDPCEKDSHNLQTLFDVVDSEVFPMEVQHDRMDFLRCVLASGELRGLTVHLSEGAPSDASARREFRMLSSEGLIQPGLIVVHGSALRAEDFQLLGQKKAGLVWSPRSNDELYGATANIAAAIHESVVVAIAPDWSPTGSAGMLQEIGYAARRYKFFGPDQLISMATSIPAQLARVNDSIGSLLPGKLADIVVIRGDRANPFQAVSLASPADIMLVVVGGQALYGDVGMLSRLLPAASLEPISVCGSKKAIYLGNSDAASRGETFLTIQAILSAALKKAGSDLTAIECD